MKSEDMPNTLCELLTDAEVMQLRMENDCVPEGCDQMRSLQYQQLYERVGNFPVNDQHYTTGDAYVTRHKILRSCQCCQHYKLRDYPPYKEEDFVDG